jgi:hypothetical protein
MIQQKASALHKKTLSPGIGFSAGYKMLQSLSSISTGRTQKNLSYDNCIVTSKDNVPGNQHLQFLPMSSLPRLSLWMDLPDRLVCRELLSHDLCSRKLSQLGKSLLGCSSTPHYFSLVTATDRWRGEEEEGATIHTTASHT